MFVNFFNKYDRLNRILSERKAFDLQFCESHIKTSKLKINENSKICVLGFLMVSRSSMLFVFLIVVSVNKRRPQQKAFVAIPSVFLKIKLESRKWHQLPAFGAPGFIGGILL